MALKKRLSGIKINTICNHNKLSYFFAHKITLPFLDIILKGIAVH